MRQGIKLQQVIKVFSQKLQILSVLILILTLIAWIVWIGPQLKKIPANFSYTADILSVDNFYDAKLKKFGGEQISKTVFNYEVVENNNNYLTIKNLFEVSTLNDKPIFSVTRIYYIDPYKGRHVVINDQEKRSGYLFAPRYTNQRDFIYWHVNYDAPALMKFVNEENIHGLTVYHYQSYYTADQTVNLGYLPIVPEKWGIKADVHLQLWIEPVSGWLVKYQDNTLAYYYDFKTHTKIAPWNSFSNRYTQNSIRQQVRQAKKLKWRILMVDFGVPSLLLVTIIIIIIATYIRKNQYSILPARVNNFLIKYKEKILPGIIYVILSTSIILSVYYLFLHRKEVVIYKIGISQWNDNSEFVTAIKGFKEGLAESGFQEGKNLKIFIKNPNASIENQINILQSFLKDRVNLIFTLTTPGTLVAKGMTRRTPVIFLDVRYPEESKIINPKSSSKSNLVGVRNYLSPALQFYQFESIFAGTKVLGFIHQKNNPESEILFQEYKSMLNKRDIQIIDIAGLDANDLLTQLELNKSKYNTLFIACDMLMRGNAGKLAANFAKKNKIPSFSCDKDSVANGALIGYFPDLYEAGNLAGKKAALILKGAEPGWLLTESVDKNYLIVNAVSAKELGLTIPSRIIKQATKIIAK